MQSPTYYLATPLCNHLGGDDVDIHRLVNYAVVD